MSVSRFTLCALIALVAAGCHGGGHGGGGHGGNQDLLERELRFQETELWRLRDEIDSISCQLEMTQRENDSLKHELAEDGPTTTLKRPKSTRPFDLPTPSSRLSPLDGAGTTRQPSRRTGNSLPTGPPGEIDMPRIELGPANPDGQGTSPDSGPLLDSIERPAPGQLPLPDESPSSPPPLEEFPSGQRLDRARHASHTTPVIAEGSPEKIVIVKQLTGGRDRDGSPGHEGITLAFEPRSKDGRLVGPAGDVSIVVLDPAATGAAGRVARWDFKSPEAAANFGGQGISRGYYFDLPWSGRPPTHETLQVFVRLVTPSGARLVADQTIVVEPPPAGAAAKTWSAARPRSLAGQPGVYAVDPTLVASAPGARERPRFFSRVKTSGNSATGTPGSADVISADRDPAGRFASRAGQDGPMEVYLDPQDGSAIATGATAMGATSMGEANGSRGAKSTRIIDRTRLRGGPGLISFDGSRLRSWTGGRSKNAVPPGNPPLPAHGAGGDASETVVYGGDPAYRGAPALAADPNGENGPSAPGVAGATVWTDRVVSSGEPTLAPSVAIEPMGGPPMIDNSAANEEPIVPQVSRPVWRPYR